MLSIVHGYIFPKTKAYFLIPVHKILVRKTPVRKILARKTLVCKMPVHKTPVHKIPVMMKEKEITQILLQSSVSMVVCYV